MQRSMLCSALRHTVSIETSGISLRPAKERVAAPGAVRFFEVASNCFAIVDIACWCRSLKTALLSAS